MEIIGMNITRPSGKPASDQPMMLSGPAGSGSASPRGTRSPVSAQCCVMLATGRRTAFPHRRHQYPGSPQGGGRGIIASRLANCGRI